MKDALEFIVRDDPFTVRRTVRWADCDPAGVVYAGRYADYLIDAVARFMRHVGFSFGGSRGSPVKVGLPCKHMELTFHSSLYPDDVIDIEVAVGEVREHTFDLVATARLLDGPLTFAGSFSPICIVPETRERMRIPAELREALQRHGLNRHAQT